MRILIVDDEEIQRITIQDELTDAGHDVEICNSGQDAIRVLEKEVFDVIITDYKMPKLNGVELLRHIKTEKISGEVLIMTAFAAIENAVESIKLGAYDYITKPIEYESLIITLAHIDNLNKLNKENQNLREQLQESQSFGKIIGKSKGMQKIYGQIKVVASENASVLITGETGTGKEIIANSIHQNSNRSKKPYVKVSCAALSRDLLESELFGHEKGAFTGAVKRKIGRFEKASQGTIFLDEVDDIPIDLQVKLLRVLQEKTLERVGGSESIKIDVRLIASTKVDLRDLVEKGQFRSDLFYRLNVFPIEIPPLSHRRDDIPILFEHFLKMYSKNITSADKETISILMDHEWEGNVRELKNLAERLSIVCKSNPIIPENLPHEILTKNKRYHDTKQKKLPAVSLYDSINEVEQRFIQEALLTSDGNKAEAARLLGIPASTLKSKLANLKKSNT